MSDYQDKKQPELIVTEDGSHTLLNPKLNEHYHSTFGAIQESKHVFIQAGLEYAGQSLKSVNLFEVGFGTGLNALLAMQWADVNKIVIEYTGVEAYSLSREMVAKLNYPEILNFNQDIFDNMHFSSAEWIQLSDYFSMKLIIGKVQEVPLPEAFYDVVFFDAFSPDVQPEMWTEEVFQKIAIAMKRGGVFTTYSTKGIVKRALKSVGFEIEKLPGPKGKREILRALKKKIILQRIKPIK